MSRRVAVAGVVLGVLHALVAPARARAEGGATPELGYSMREQWDGWWRRVMDRSGRPDPTGPVQQRFAALLQEEYAINLTIPEFPLRNERAFVERPGAVRLATQSLNEFELSTLVHMKTRIRMSRSWHLGVDYHKDENRLTHSDLLILEGRYAPPGRAAPYAALGFTPRMVKEDLDVIATVGYRAPRIDARVRAYLLDPFTNAAYALAESRSKLLPVRLHQLEVPLATTFELSARPHCSVYTELYLGAILPQRTRSRAQEPEGNHVQELRGALAGALIEGRPRVPVPVWLGASAMTVATRFARVHSVTSELDRSVVETTHTVMGYALFAPLRRLHGEVYVKWIGRPERTAFLNAPGMSSARSDDEWIISARADLMLSRSAGVELGLNRDSRSTEGPPSIAVDGVRRRLITRASLRLGPRVTARLGISWDIGTAGRSPFGGASLTLDAALP